MKGPTRLGVGKRNVMAGATSAARRVLVVQRKWFDNEEWKGRNCDCDAGGQ
jgi:hypothetical protein